MEVARRPEFLLSGASTAFHETKRSRFEAFAEPFRSPQDFDALYERLRDPKATHSAWAWRLGEQSRCCDDGELSGTAGRSILVAIDGALLDQVLVVVRRYYGGIRLGCGGLLRAYGGVAAQCLQEAPTRPLLQLQRCRLQVAFEQLSPVYAAITRFSARRLFEQYNAEGVVLELELSSYSFFRRDVDDVCRGRAVWEEVSSSR